MTLGFVGIVASRRSLGILGDAKELAGFSSSSKMAASTKQASRQQKGSPDRQPGRPHVAGVSSHWTSDRIRIFQRLNGEAEV